MLSEPEPSDTLTTATVNMGDQSTDIKPILALKELVASLYREQNKVQNLLSSLGFALRSFNNLNQFLDLTPLMAARVADAEGGALILSKNNGQVALDQLHCQDNQINGELRRQLEAIIRQLNQEAALENKNSRSLLDSLDHKIRQTLEQGTQVYSTPVFFSVAGHNF